MKPLPLASLLLLLTFTGCQQTPPKKIDAVPLPETTSSQPASAPALSDVGSPQAAAASKAGAITTPSGLQYQVLASGPITGRSPTRSDTVKVHYRGTLTDGTVFDSSIDRGEPATFGVGQVIAGWTEALQLMRPGDRWQLFIPAHLAYGNRAVGGKIPPNSDLIFTVELLEILGGR